MNMKRWTTLAACLATVVFAAGVHAGDMAKVGEAAPGFTLMDHHGKEVSLADYDGKIVVLEWTNPECPFVQRHYKEGTMVELAKEFADEDVVWLSVNSTNYWDTAKNDEWAHGQKLPYAVLNDASGEVGHKYGAKTTPHMFVIASDGTLAYAGAIDDGPRGDASVNYVEAALESLIAGKDIEVTESKPYGCSVKYAKSDEKKKDTVG